jgi:NAD(P)H-dependent flavin oxidoreductase YrpB (nitropropane dioxygenase family)
MRSIPTRMTARFGCRHPFASAGMAFAGGTPDLALAVCAGGGIGAVGAGLTPAEQLRSIIRKVRAGTDAAFNVNLITCLDNDSRIRVCAEEKVPVASFHWGHPSPEHLKRLRDAGVSVWEQVGDVEAAKRAIGDGVEVVVAQGWEAGGHNYRGLTTMALVPQVLDAVSPALVLAAGGIADGRGVAGALALVQTASGSGRGWLRQQRQRFTPNTSGASSRAAANKPCSRRFLAPNGPISIR